VIRLEAVARRSIYSADMATQTGTAQSHSVTDSTTIEVMLSGQQLSALANSTRIDATQHHRSRIIICAVIAAVLVVSGGVAHLAAKQRPVHPAVVRASTPQPPPTPVEPPAPAAAPVLFKNPFDHSEVFEFPPGTTQDEARDTVAKLLLDRAQGRGPDVLRLKIRKVHNASRSR
jgi:hypothetical protein